MISDGPNPAAMDCACCSNSKCAESPRFLQLASSGGGLHVYQHVMNHGPTHMITFIFHNTTDNPIKPDHFSDLDPKTVDCPRCRYNLTHAHKLLKEFPQIDRKGIVGVCQQCRPKEDTDNTCKECLIAIQRFKSALDQRVNATNAMNDRKGYLADLKSIKENEINNFRSDAIGAQPRSKEKSRIYDFKDIERQFSRVDQSRGPHSDQFHRIDSSHMERDCTNYTDVNVSSDISRDTKWKDQPKSFKSKVDKRTLSRKDSRKQSSTENDINKYLGKVIKGKGHTLNEYYFPKTTDPRQKLSKLKKQISSSEVIDRSRDIIKRKEDKNRQNTRLKEKQKENKSRQKYDKEDYSSDEIENNDTEKRKRCIEEKSRKHSGKADDLSTNEKSSKAKQGIRDKKYTKKDNDDDLNGTKITTQKKYQEKHIKKGFGHQTREESDRGTSKNNASPGKSGKVNRIKKDKVSAAGDISSEERSKKDPKKPNGKKSDRSKSSKKYNSSDEEKEETLKKGNKSRYREKGDRSKSSKKYNSSDEEKEETLKKGNKSRNREKGDRNQLRDNGKTYDTDTNYDERSKKGKGNKDEGNNKQGKEKLGNEYDQTDRFSKNERKEGKATVDTNNGKKQKLLGAAEVKSKRPSPEQLQANIAQKDKVIVETLTLAMKAKKDIIFDDSKLEKKQVVPEYTEAFIPKIGKDIKELDIKYTIIPEIIDSGEMTEQKDCEVCAQIDSVVDFFDEANKNMAEEQPEIIIENKIYKLSGLSLKRSPNFLSVHDIKDKDFSDEDTVVLNRDLQINEGRRHPNTAVSSKFQRSAGSLPSSDMSHSEQKGVIKYSLSDPSFIDKGWTQMPTEKLVRKMNVYRMRPAHPQSGWFDHYRGKGLMQYPTGEKLAEFDDEGRGRWFYRNGRVALDYYDAEELNAQHRVVVYSSGEPDARGRFHPVTILATFDYLGNGIVFDHAGKNRLKYNQSEGVVLDRSLGPVSTWKWHSLNDPPSLQRVMIDQSQPDPDIDKLADTNEKPGPENEEMLALEYDNVKNKSRTSQKFKPFQIKMKALKINENFSLRVLDQATVYLIFRDGTTTLKVNLGMLLDHKEIIDVATADVVASADTLPALGTSPSIEGILEMVEEARQQERARARRRPAVPRVSVGSVVKAHGKTGDFTSDGAGDYQRKMKPTSNRVYYNTNTT